MSQKPTTTRWTGRIAAIAAVCAASAIFGVYAAARITYPETKRVDVTDDYNGKTVVDPYRWLEQDPRTSPDVAQWIAAQNKVTQAWLQQVPERQQIHERLTSLW
ncbi:MAG TPA: S9 family peptidase, partial [Candidatus Polarisedimenticolia bacterium]|nr:S9 family peptidase [Candidatus Polarisedimenticolia bacterium]